MDNIFIKSIEFHIGEGQIIQAIDKLLDVDIYNEKRHDLLILRCKLKDNIRHFQIGLIDVEYLDKLKTKICQYILEMIGTHLSNFEENTYVNEEKIKYEVNVIMKADLTQRKCRIIPLIPRDVSATYTMNFDDISKSTFEYISVPTFFNGDKIYAFKVNGDSMLPVTENMYVIARPIFRKQHIKPAQRYIIITRDEIVFKRVILLNGDRYLLISDNEIHSNGIIDGNDIQLIFECLDIVLNTETQVTGQIGKIRSLYNELSPYLGRSLK